MKLTATDYVRRTRLTTSPIDTDSDMCTHLLTVRLVHHCRHLVLHQHHRNSLHRTTRVRHRYHSQVRLRRIPRHRWRAGNGCTEEHQLHVRTMSTPLSNHLTHPQQKYAQTRSSAHDACCEMHVIRRLLARLSYDILMVVTKRRRKSRLWLPVDDDEESDVHRRTRNPSRE